eukprot:95504-Chlamydomonas_euryale.AAC.6
MLDAILTRRFVPASLAKRASPSLPGTPTARPSAAGTGSAWARIDGAERSGAGSPHTPRQVSRKEAAVIVPGDDDEAGDGGSACEDGGVWAASSSRTHRVPLSSKLEASGSTTPKAKSGAASPKATSGGSSFVSRVTQPALLGQQLLLAASRRMKSAELSKRSTPPPLGVEASGIEVEELQLPADAGLTTTLHGVDARRRSIAAARASGGSTAAAEQLPELETRVVGEGEAVALGSAAMATPEENKKKKKKKKDKELVLDEDGNPVEEKKKKKDRELVFGEDGTPIAAPDKKKKKKKKEKEKELVFDEDGTPVATPEKKKKKKDKEVVLDEDGNPVEEKKKKKKKSKRTDGATTDGAATDGAVTDGADPAARSRGESSHQTPVLAFAGQQAGPSSGPPSPRTATPRTAFAAEEGAFDE